jgi:hypothetical protein
MRKLGFLLLMAISCSSFAAMDKSKTIYKCMQGKKVVYTDEPCISGTEPEIVPTQGLDKDSGRSLKGNDVQALERREIWHENFVKPLTGMSREEYKILTERMKLPPKDKEECYKLDSKLINDKEALKTAIDKTTREQRELNLFETRKRFKILKC